jgi:hypothetical protein
LKVFEELRYDVDALETQAAKEIRVQEDKGRTAANSDTCKPSISASSLQK